jgi:hypothetical protein
MRWRHVTTVVAALMLAAILFAVSADADGVPPQLSEAESQALVQSGVQGTFEGFVPPPGAVPSSLDPAGADWELAVPRDWSQEALAYGWWVVPGTAGDAISWLRAHAPVGAEIVSVQREPSWARFPSSIGFQWREVPRARGPITLDASVMPLPSGGIGLLVTVEGFWLRPRPVGEAIPGRMRRLMVTAWLRGPTSRPSGRHELRLRQRPVIVTDPARIERVVSLFNSLPLVQSLRGPAPPCALPTYEVVLRVAFYSAGQSSPAAVARDEGGGECAGGLTLELAGRVEPRLEPGADLSKEVSEAIGAPGGGDTGKVAVGGPKGLRRGGRRRVAGNGDRQ